MDTTNVLNSELQMEGDVAVVTSTVRQAMSKDYVVQQINTLRLQQRHVVGSVEALRKQYADYTAKLEEFQQILSQFPPDDLAIEGVDADGNL